jgi:hypothetical protein
VTDQHAIDTADALRAIIGEVNPAVQVKINPAIDEFARAYRW